MNQGSDPTPDPARSPQGGDGDPHGQLGIAVDATFEQVQEARQARLAELGDDGIARARIEAAYDAILMNRLRERQQGKVSTAARSASQREQVSPGAGQRSAGPALPRLPQLPTGGLPRPSLRLPTLQLASGRELWFPLAVGCISALLLFSITPAPAELALALSTLACLLNLQRRQGRFWSSLGWTLVLLSLGVLLGGLLTGLINQQLPLGLPISLDQVRSLPALVLLVLGALLLA